MPLFVLTNPKDLAVPPRQVPRRPLAWLCHRNLNNLLNLVSILRLHLTKCVQLLNCLRGTQGELQDQRNMGGVPR